MELFPAVSIGLPPGLEDVIRPVETTVALASSHLLANELEADIFAEDHHLPKGLLDSLDPEAPQFVPASMKPSWKQPSALDPEAPQFVPAALQQSDMAHAGIEKDVSSLDPEAPHFVPASMLQQPTWRSEERFLLSDSSVVPLHMRRSL